MRRLIYNKLHLKTRKLENNKFNYHFFSSVSSTHEKKKHTKTKENNNKKLTNLVRTIGGGAGSHISLSMIFGGGVRGRSMIRSISCCGCGLTITYYILENIFWLLSYWFYKLTN